MKKLNISNFLTSDLFSHISSDVFVCRLANRFRISSYCSLFFFSVNQLQTIYLLLLLPIFSPSSHYHPVYFKMKIISWWNGDDMDIIRFLIIPYYIHVISVLTPFYLRFTVNRMMTGWRTESYRIWINIIYATYFINIP